MDVKKNLKSGVEGTKKFIKKHHKKVEKNLKKIFIITAIIIAVVFIVLLILGIKVKFVLDDELNIRLDPLESNLFISNKDNANLSFIIRNDNFRQCRSYCQLTLFDLSNNKIIYSENRTMKHKEEIIKSFVIEAPGKGSGQLLYSFEVKCNNLKSLVCLTDESARYKSAIITINYNLTEEESAVKQNFMPLLLNLTSDINRLSVELEKNKLLIGKINSFTSEKERLSEESGLIEDEFNALVSETLGLIDLWKSEEYIRLDDGSGKLLSPSSLDKNISNAREDILDMIELRNNNINILESVGLLKDRLKEITETYRAELNSKNLKELQELSEIFDNIINSYFILELKKVHSEEILSSDLNYNANILKNKIKAFSNISVHNAFLDIYGRSLIAVKNNSSLDSQNPEFCRSLRNITSDISDLNNASVDFKEDYYSIIINSSEFDRKLEEAKRSIEFIALKKSEEYVKGSSLEFRNDILAIIEKEIELKRDYSDISTSDFNLSISEDSSINISAEDMYKMVILDNYDNELFIAENCRDPGFKENFSETFESFFSANFSSLERYSPEISEPITTISLEFKDNPPRCCAFGVCNNCSLKKEAYPVILIHGHNMNNANSPQRAMNDFTKLQQKLQKDSFINVGELNLNLYLSEDIKDLWGMSGNPVSVRSSYYYIIDYKLGSYRMDVQKSERIENYALRLKEIIDVVKFKTGAEKVDIIAHSMGGLVARQYISIFGTGDIDKIITINTPNEGISTNIQKFCSVLGSSKECDDMSEGSIFLNRLNSKSIPDNLYVIRSTGCKMGETTGDGIVTNESAYLKGAKNYLIEGKCTDALNTNLHTNVLDPELYPEIYKLIKDILEE